MPIIYEFKGMCPNTEVLHYYAHHKIDCFISASSTEGLPVSIMEAISYGIPVVATNAGGTAELIDGNGFLLNLDTSGAEIADAVYRVMSSEEDSHRFSERSYQLWEKKYDAKRNAKIFQSTIAEICDQQLTRVVFTTDSLKDDWPFLKEELFALADHYHIVLIETGANESDSYRQNIIKTIQEKTDRIQILNYIKDNSILKKIKYGIVYHTDRNISCERKEIRSDPHFLKDRLLESMKDYLDAQLFYEWLEKEQILCDGMLYYTYWHQFYTLAMLLHKETYQDAVVVTRTHGYDLYDERRIKTLRQPFRSYMDGRLDAVFFACEYGRDYYLKRHQTGNSDKYFVRYIGSSKEDEEIEIGTKIHGSDSAKDVVRLVSCSYLVALKRVELIIDAISQLSSLLPDRTIEWVHFGDGEERELLETYARKKLCIS